MLYIYKSSAGSGKTYTLILEYLRLALQKNDPTYYKHILAITFTNKAANEIKARIIEGLKEIVENQESNLRNELINYLQLEENELVKRSTLMLQNILHNYSDLAVSTIDSFVHKIVRAFSFELKLQSNFNIEMDEDLLRRSITQQLLDSVDILANPSITNALLDFIKSNLEDSRSWDLKKQLMTFSKELFKEDVQPFIKSLSETTLEDYEKLKILLKHQTTFFENNIRDIGREALEKIAQNELEISDFYFGKTGIAGFFKKLSEFDKNSETELKSTVLKTIEEDIWYASKTPTNIISKIENCKFDLLKIFKKFETLNQEEGPNYVLANLLLQNFYSLMLLSELNKQLTNYKTENNVLFISDFQEKINHIVSHQDAPVIYERLGDWYDSILIDEFQDTSVLQWKNLLPLIENSQTKNNDSLIVGDAKQAIYRFRAGEVKQFTQLPKIYQSEDFEILKAREIAINNYGTQLKYLSKNYRSRNEIIKFNNSFYETLLQNQVFKIEDSYTNHSQEIGTNKEGGFVKLQFYNEEEIEAFSLIEDTISQVKKLGYQYEDIAILTRSNSTGASIASHLIELGIPVISSDSLLISQSSKVKLIIAVMHYLMQPSSVLLKTEILYFSNLKILNKSVLELKQLIKNSHLDFEKQISQIFQNEFSSQKLVGNKILVIAHQILHIFKIDYSQDAFIQFFFDEILKFTKQHGNQLSLFLSYWEDKKWKLSISTPDTLNAVKVLTVHKSKGLQYPIVIIPDASSKMKITKNYLWADLKMEEKNLPVAIPYQKKLLKTNYSEAYSEEQNDSFLDMLNVLYVATTRAEDHLYIFSKAPAKPSLELINITSILYHFLLKTNQWTDFGIYEFGNANTQKQTKKLKENKVLKFEEYEISLQKNETYNAISQSNNLNKKSEEQIFGKHLHAILSKIYYHSQKNAIIEKYCVQNFLLAETKSKIITAIDFIIFHPELTDFFTEKYEILTENAILSTALKDKIPDRINILKDTNEAIIIDYKTGEESEKYISQIQEYGELITKINYQCTSKILIYTTLSKIVFC